MSSPQRRSPSADRKEQSKSHAAFWRACRYLFPYRGIVTVSILCALFVGVAFAGGLGTMLPIMRVLIEGDTLQNWMNREIAEKRLGVRLFDEPGRWEASRFWTSQKRTAPPRKPGCGRAGSLSVPGTRRRSRRCWRPSPIRPSSTLPVGAGDKVVTLSLPSIPWYHGLRPARRRIDADRPSAGDRGGLRADLRAGDLVERRQVLPGILLRQGRRPRRSTTSAGSSTTTCCTCRWPLRPRGTSDVTSRLVQDSQQMELGFKTVLGQSDPGADQGGAWRSALALYVSWKLTLFIIVFVPVMAVIIQKFGKKMRRASRAALQNSSRHARADRGDAGGIRVVKGASAERFERRRYSRIMSQAGRRAASHEPDRRVHAADAGDADAVRGRRRRAVRVATWCSRASTLETTSFFLVMACLTASATRCGG